MSDQRYDYENTIAVKIIVKKDDQIFLLREPKTNDWMPGRLALPGGKLLLGESVFECLERKIRTEIGFEIEIKGLTKIVDILMPDKNVYHLIFLANYKNGEIDLTKIEAKEAAWYPFSEIIKFDKNSYAEYYNEAILRAVISGKEEVVPMSIFQIQNNNQQNIMSWMKDGMPEYFK